MIHINLQLTIDLRQHIKSKKNQKIKVLVFLNKIETHCDTFKKNLNFWSVCKFANGNRDREM